MLRTCSTSELLFTISKDQNLHWRQSLEEVFLPHQETHLQCYQESSIWFIPDASRLQEPAREPRHLRQEALPYIIPQNHPSRPHRKVCWFASSHAAPCSQPAVTRHSAALPRNKSIKTKRITTEVPGTQQRGQRSHVQRKLLFVRETWFQTLVLTYLDFDKMLWNKHKGLVLVRTPGKIWSEEEACKVPTRRVRTPMQRVGKGGGGWREPRCTKDLRLVSASLTRKDAKDMAKGGNGAKQVTATIKPQATLEMF